MEESKLKEEQTVEEDEVDEEEEKEEKTEDGTVKSDGPSKKKKRKPKKKKKAATNPDGTPVQSQTQQPPKNADPFALIEAMTPVRQLFPTENYPEGEIQMYKDDNLWRNTSAEKREVERLSLNIYKEARLAAEVHRRVRKEVQGFVKPGMKLVDICKRLEATNRRLVEAYGLERGIAFPTGCSINRCAAHYTPNTGDDTILGEDDVLKLDFGTHVNGRIIDCAWTMAFNPVFDPLLKAVKEATNTGIKEAGIDVRLCDIGAAIQEVMESYEITLPDGKTYPIKSIKNLNGHSIDPYVIHAGKSVPICKNNDTTRMEEGEFYAIETFGSTGKGIVQEDMECSHYMAVKDPPFAQLRQQTTKLLYSYIKKKYDTLAFCRRWLDEDGQTRHIASLRQLVQAGLVTAHLPLCDVKGSYTAQYEHTLVLRPTCKEVLSRGEDF
eukprot:TRINITY_DN11364_c0_g1_i1.p1 TRINITY_DN11364_c0_g1~~TRINITY_DN11364_c0_g1_i1.p1  ORF type:complete len:438 (-),score=143.53 TRINITY_DN11364_c0_g1_i1:238-1551(-)